MVAHCTYSTPRIRQRKLGVSSQKFIPRSLLGKLKDAFAGQSLAWNLGPQDAITMRDTRTIGDIEGVSPMGIGTWAWGNKFLWGYNPDMDPELQELFNYVVSKGINLFDTADSYGTGALNGRSEQLLGQFMRENKDVQAGRQVHIATKLAGYPWRITPWNMTAACKGSLRRLGAEQVAIGQLHWSAAKYAPLQEAAMVAGMADCYDQGLVRAVGVSNYGPKQLLKVQQTLQKRGVPLASAQIQFSLLSYSPLQQRLLQEARASGIALIAYSPLALGLLSGKYSEKELPAGPRGALFRKLLPEAAPVLEVLRDVAVARGKSQSQVAINWCICKGCIPIPGVKSMAMAEDNCGAVGWRLTDTEEAALDEAAASVRGGGMVQNIFQTQ